MDKIAWSASSKLVIPFSWATSSATLLYYNCCRGFKTSQSILNQLQLFRPIEKWISGHYFHTIMIDPDRYKAYVAEEFVKNGGKFENVRVDDLRTLKHRLAIFLHV